MTLPVEAARVEVRSVAMGIYFAIYYASMALGPAVLGVLRDSTGSAEAPLIAASALLSLCLVGWATFRLYQRRRVRA